ncbi:hypothetical protein K501DRAFT_276691 [Backusella circina FSU 941]|nr:hypothetical protein K501DRAFT_276691 [Backusella circina FSU 941]
MSAHFENTMLCFTKRLLRALFKNFKEFYCKEFRDLGSLLFYVMATYIDILREKKHLMSFTFGARLFGPPEYFTSPRKKKKSNERKERTVNNTKRISGVSNGKDDEHNEERLRKEDNDRSDHSLDRRKIKKNKTVEKKTGSPRTETIVRTFINNKWDLENK